nr:DUF1993 family protein [Agrobacterium tumefaciens]
MPNFQFRAVTAYDILRTHGAPIGKRDYEGQLRTRSAWIAAPGRSQKPAFKDFSKKIRFF